MVKPQKNHSHQYIQNQDIYKKLIGLGLGKIPLILIMLGKIRKR